MLSSAHFYFNAKLHLLKILSGRPFQLIILLLSGRSLSEREREMNGKINCSRSQHTMRHSAEQNATCVLINDAASFYSRRRRFEFVFISPAGRTEGLFLVCCSRISMQLIWLRMRSMAEDEKRERPGSFYWANSASREMLNCLRCDAQLLTFSIVMEENWH